MQFILQKKYLVFSAMFLLLSCAVFVFLYMDINKNVEASKLAQEEWQTETAQREYEKSLVDSIKKIEPERALLEGHFVQSSNVVSFLDTIEKIAKNAGVRAEVTSVEVVKDSTSLEVRIQTEGSFGAIYRLITLLENSPYSLEFVLGDIQTSNTQSKTVKIPQWTATFQIKLLSFVNK